MDVARANVWRAAVQPARPDQHSRPSGSSAWRGSRISTARRGQEATPLVVDGVLYVSTAWSKVKAYDAATGKPLWAYDPEVPGEWAVNACCDVVNRGVAVWEGKVFVGSFDGRLIALDAATGRELWDVNTIDRTKPYTITGAPRVVKGKVIIGNGGAEFGVRGYVSAYDARDRGAGVAVLHGARQSRRRLREPHPEDGRHDVERRVVEARRRRHRVGLHGLRSRTRPAVCRRRQRLAVEPPDPQRGQGRQPVSRLDRRARPRRRLVRLALPDLAGRNLGPHGDAAHHRGRPASERRRRAAW